MDRQSQLRAKNGEHPGRNSTRFQGENTVGKLVVTIVDTGSTFMAVPRALLQRLGVPVRRSARSLLADGREVAIIGVTHHP